MPIGLVLGLVAITTVTQLAGKTIVPEDGQTIGCQPKGHH